jgi:hypothetical protein
MAFNLDLTATQPLFQPSKNQKYYQKLAFVIDFSYSQGSSLDKICDAILKK